MSSENHSTFHNVKESVKDAAETVGDKLHSVGEAIKDKAETAKDKITGVFSGHSEDKECDSECQHEEMTHAERALFEKRQELQRHFQLQADEAARRAADAMTRKAEQDNAAVECAQECVMDKAQRAHDEVHAAKERLLQKESDANDAIIDAKLAVNEKAYDAMQNAKQTAEKYSDVVRHNAADAYEAATNAADNAKERLSKKAESDYIRNIDNVNCATANMRQQNDAATQVHRIALP